MNLETYGWNEFFEKEFLLYKDAGLVPGRILKETRHVYTVYTEKGALPGEISGHFHYTAVEKADYPAIGDWVAVREGEEMVIIEKVLPRKTSFSRKAAGRESEEQVVAANIDFIGIVSGLDGGRNFTLRGIERYLAMAVEGGASPVLILNKVDLTDDREGALQLALSIAGDVPVHLVSAVTGEGIEELARSFGHGATVAFTGASGVGKSALINALMGEKLQETGHLRESDLRGRHTTTHKELFFLSGGAMVIDTPGMRELQLWGSEESLNDTFAEIHEAGKDCRFKDCTHQGEPGCAVQKLLVEGGLEPDRYQNYLDMRRELEYLNSRLTEKGRQDRKAKEKELARLIKRTQKK